MFPSARILLLVALSAGLSGQPAWAQEGGEEAASRDADRSVRRVGDTAGEEYRIDLSIPEAGQAAADGTTAQLPDPEQNQRLQELLSRLAARPGNRAALDELDGLLTQVLEQASVLMGQRQLDAAAQQLAVVRNVNPRQDGLETAEARLDDLRQAQEVLVQARTAFEGGDLVEPPGESAAAYYQRALALDADNPDARRGLLQVQQALLEEARESARNLDFEGSEQLLEAAGRVRAPQELVVETRVEIEAFRDRKAVEIEQDIVRAIQHGEFDYAEFTLIDLIALGGNEPRVEALRERIRRERIYGQYQPGDIIQDQLTRHGGTAPAVVVVASGSFLMGSPGDERGREDHEQPQHRVEIGRGFGLGLQEVTVGQFGEFMQATGYRTQAERDGKSTIWDETLGRLAERPGVRWSHDFEGNPAAASLPVVHVSWDDAQAYLRWLSEETGANYRLPSEAEFEYAIRAGSVSAYWWGDSNRPRDVVENLTGERDVSSTGRNWGSFFRGYGDDHWGPAPGGSFIANPFGLFDMAGNVSEWIEDCWHSSYLRAPADGSAWVNPGCPRHVVRGGYWASAPEQARSAARLSADRSLHGPRVGFRVARDL